MFNGSYYTDILLHEVKGKPYNKKWLMIKNRLQQILLIALIFLFFLLSGCSETKKFARWKDKGERNGWLLKDTLYFTDTIRGFTKDTIVQFDTLTHTDTLTVEKNGIKTVTVIKWKDRIVSQVITQRDTIKHYAKPIYKDCPPCPKDKFQWSAFWKGFGCCAVLGFITFLILKFK